MEPPQEGRSGYLLRQAWHEFRGAMDGVLATLERAGLVERHPHPTHGRILQVYLTSEGQRRLEAARPSVERLERIIEEGLSAEQVALIKEWLVTTAQRMVEDAASGDR
jgi:DNA-binding MarR family transcriptional regulator